MRTLVNEPILNSNERDKRNPKLPEGWKQQTSEQKYMKQKPEKIIEKTTKDLILWKD